MKEELLIEIERALTVLADPAVNVRTEFLEPCVKEIRRLQKELAKVRGETLTEVVSVIDERLLRLFGWRVEEQPEAVGELEALAAIFRARLGKG